MKLNFEDWIIIVFLIFTFLSCLNGKVILFGENCTNEKECGGTAENLICNTNNHTCECPENQSFDHTSNRCSLLIGQPCTNDTECFQLSTCTPQWNSTSGSFKKKCGCVGKFYFIDQLTQTCQESAKYGESCNGITELCQDHSFLICDRKSNTCICENEEIQIYDTYKKKCAIRIDEQCYNTRSQFDDACINNGYCEYYFASKKPTICKCKHGYIKGNVKGETCLATHMQYCNKTSICHEDVGLICTDGQCLCNSPMYQVFDDKINKCVGIIGSDCTNNTSCISNAICDLNSLKCQCDVNFSETLDKKSCKLNYEIQCESDQIDTCNYDRGLVCKNNKCVCYDSLLKYNTKLNICTNLEGNICGKLKQNRIHMRGKQEIEINGNVIIVGCDEGFICAKVQGKESCNCLDLQIVESDKTFRINLCL